MTTNSKPGWLASLTLHCDNSDDPRTQVSLILLVLLPTTPIQQSRIYTTYSVDPAIDNKDASYNDKEEIW